MFKILKADKDSYITDKIIDGLRVVSGNVGTASSLDLFKLYGMSETDDGAANIELSRVLIHFDLDPLRELISSEKIDITSPTFNCTLKMFDVDGGQTVPTNFDLLLHPLSRSFDEGLGRDIVLFGDNDTCNFLSGSVIQGSWILSGANQGGLATDQVDYITTAVIESVSSSMEVSQTFNGIENLEMNVTNLVSATISGKIPDEGFRLAFSPSIETDTMSYFVKRFASRTAYDETYHPRLEVRFDNSVQDDSLNLQFDNDATLFFYNFNQGSLSNLISGSGYVTGSNSIVLKMETAISGGFYALEFTGSQHTLVGNSNIEVTGMYSASILIPSSDVIIANKISQSGSVEFVPIWGSVDGTLAYHTGSKLTVRPSGRGSSANVPFTTDVTVLNLNPEHLSSEVVPVKVNIFDRNSPLLTVVKIPCITPGLVIRDVHYQIRSTTTGETIIPFDTTYNSTRISSDDEGMFFDVDMSNLHSGRSYVIDIMIVVNGKQHIHQNASPEFRVKA